MSSKASSYTFSHQLAGRDIPLAQLQSETGRNRLVVGVAIFDQDNGTLLLLQRAAHEPMFPNMYELPGGKAEMDVDTSILDTVVRETAEESNLQVTEIVKEFDSFEYPVKSGAIALQLNFIVKAHGSVRIASEEHQNFAWVSRDTFKEYAMSPTMADIVDKAFGQV